MRRKVYLSAGLLSLVCLVFLGSVGAGPQQGVPPQPYFEDYFSGTITVQGEPAPAGVTLVACIDDCRDVYESDPMPVEEGGRYTLLKVFPPEEKGLWGHDITFYLVNQHGRIQALETAAFDRAPIRRTLDLTFNRPLPGPEPTPALPVVGDPAVTVIPRVALIGGGAVALVGALLVLAARRRAS